jgi:oxygen-dependent protoporphyrinogen oxidase
LLNYIGGSRDVALADLPEKEIIAEVDKGCRQVLLKDDAPEPKVLGIKIWPTAIPQYELGHLPLMKELEDAESKLPGLWVCGNYRTGVAFPDCVTFGYEQAQVVTDYLNGGGSAKTSTPTPPKKVAKAAITSKKEVLPFFLEEVEGEVVASR